jgi:hypothetical protein
MNVRINPKCLALFKYIFSGPCMINLNIPCAFTDKVTTPGYTVLFHSIRQSRVTGLPKSTKSHDCHGDFGKLTKPFLDSKNHFKLTSKILNNRKKISH